MDLILIENDEDVLQISLEEVFQIVAAEFEDHYRNRLLVLERMNDRLIGELRLLREVQREPAKTTV